MEHDDGVPPSRIVLAGYGQGGVLALQAGLTYKHAVAGIAAFSAWIPGYLAKVDKPKLGIPIFSGHLGDDGVCPYDISFGTCNTLRSGGFSCTFEELLKAGPEEPPAKAELHVNHGKLNLPTYGKLSADIVPAPSDIELSDRLQALPDEECYIDGIEYFKPGDLGTVSRFYINDIGEERVCIEWDRTGLTSGYPRARWFEKFIKVVTPAPQSSNNIKATQVESSASEAPPSAVSDGSPLGMAGSDLPTFRMQPAQQTLLEDRVRSPLRSPRAAQALPAKVVPSQSTSAHAQLSRQAGLPPPGPPKVLSSVTSPSPQHRVIGVSSASRSGSKEPLMNERGIELKVGHRLRALPGISFHDNVKEYFKEGDLGTVSSFYTTNEGEERLRIEWDRTGLTSGYPNLSWWTMFKFESNAPLLMGSMRFDASQEASPP